MRPNKTDIAMPVTFEARERLRDQQREETVRLEGVLAAQRRLASQRKTADRAIAKAEQAVAIKQADLDRAVVALLETSGLPRTALLLGRTEADLVRISRAERRRSMIKGAGRLTTTRVPA